MSQAMYNAARTYTAAGLSVAPVRLADKLPWADLLPKNSAGRRVWSPFQAHIPSDDWLRDWFIKHNACMALVCGRVSGGLELIDFDHHPPDQSQVFDPWAGLVESQAAGLVARLIVARTQHDGRHVIYRCPEIAGNQKLAQYPTAHPATDRPMRGTLIETRGEGGYALVAPSPGYTVLQGSLTAIPSITPVEREILLAAARSFNTTAETISAPPSVTTDASASAGLRPGDDYNERTTLAETAALLTRHAWTEVHRQGDVSYWRRPRKDHGWSATLNHFPGKFYVFSSNADPFVNERAYDPFAVYALLEHDGDWAAAARALGRAGYGAQLPARRTGHGAGRATAPAPHAAAESEDAAAPNPEPCADASTQAELEATADQYVATPASLASELTTPAALPQIIVTNRPLPAITTEALAALRIANAPPELFVRSGVLARVRSDERGRPVIDDVDAGILRGRMARTDFWYRTNQNGDLRHIPPPDDVVKDLLALGAWPFPPLEALTETPALRPVGTILDRPGYDPATGLYYLPPRGFTAPAVPSHPSQAEVRAAVDLIEEAIGEFPYADAASRANTWALLLTPILRPAIRGNTPLALIDKPQAGTGASLLAELGEL